jgi:hypothetical protein
MPPDLAVKVAEIAEAQAELRAELLSARWVSVQEFMAGVNEHLRLIHERLDRLERALPADGQSGP